jgi:hypothetical protein
LRSFLSFFTLREFPFHTILETRTSITVQLVGAKGPSGNADAVYYVERRGTYVLERVEEWPPLPGKAKKRFLLTLRAYPPR